MLKKSLIHSLAALVLLVVCLSSCSKKDEYTNVIPADAGVVVSMDVRSMVEKSGLEGQHKDALMQKFLDGLKPDVSAASFQQIEKMVKNPEESGLSVRDRIYFFNSAKNLACVVKVADETKLKETFKLLEEQKLASAVESADGFSWVSMEGNTLCAFNKNVLLVLGSTDAAGTESLKANAKIWLAQKEENSIRKNPGFRKIDDQKKDITLYASLASVPNMEMAQAMANFPEGTGMKDLMILGSLNFEKGRMVAKAEVFTENKELKKMMDEQNCTMKPSGEFFDFFPASTLMFLNLSLNGEKLYETLAANPQFAGVLNNPQTGIDVKKLLSSFKGDISVGVTGFTGIGVPAVQAFAKMNGNYLMELIASNTQLIQMGLGAKVTPKGKDAYLLNYQGMDIFMGMTGNYLYVTNDPGAVARLNEKVANPMTDSQWASEAGKSPAFFAVNVTEIMKNPLLGAMASSGDPNMGMAMSVFSKCSYLQVFESSKGVAEMDIVLQNQDENVLKQLAGAAEAFAGK